jgi:hypothetical protein
MDPIADDEIRSLLQKDRTGGLCTGFVIDGNMAVELETYFREDRTGSRTVRRPFP